MPPIDYSKWDNIDTDSESENVAPPAPKTAPKPKPQPVPAPVPAPAPTPTTTSPTTPTTTTTTTSTGKKAIKAVIVRCQGDKGLPWSATTIPADHPIFDNAVPPVPALLDFPVVVHRVGTRDTGEFGCLDNQPITYLHIDPISGLAPPAWQAGRIGTVIVARKDRRDLSPEHYEAIWMYIDRILDHFGNGGPPPQHLYKRASFERWFVGYQKECLGYASVGYPRPEWRDVAPLY